MDSAGQLVIFRLTMPRLTSLPQQILTGRARAAVPVYTVTSAQASVNEGASVTFNVTAQGVPNGTVLYYTLSRPEDFAVASGSFTVTNLAGNFAVTPTADATTEGSETFTASVRTGSISGTVVAESGSVTINDTSLNPTYAVTPAANNVNEGASVTFTVTTTDVPNGTPLYWSTNTVSGTVNASDFTDGLLTGSFTITSNSGTVVRSISADAVTEGAESFSLSIRTVSTSGTVQVTSATVTINDTSLTPPLTVDYVVVAGGGGGGKAFAGGGGAGGYRTDVGVALVLATNYTVTIGAGGGNNANGFNSTFSTITSIGGGRGGAVTGYDASPSPGRNGGGGGSGGGGSGSDNNTDFAPNGTGGAASNILYGKNGGDGLGGGSYEGAGGGGGGAVNAGSNAVSGTRGGAGGAGALSAITEQYYAGGGGGASRTDRGDIQVSGGIGGGGIGGGASGGNGSANSGGGGGGGGEDGSDFGSSPLRFGGTGGSGVVILKYPAAYTISNPGGGLTITTPAAAGGFKISTITVGTGNVQFN